MEKMLIDFLVDNITANPKYAPGFFEGVPLDKINQTAGMFLRSPGSSVSEYGTAETFEFS